MLRGDCGDLVHGYKPMIFHVSLSTGLGNRSGANIYTFACPYCQKPNFDRDDLLRHVMGLHKDENPKVVCIGCVTTNVSRYKCCEHFKVIDAMEY